MKIFSAILGFFMALFNTPCSGALAKLDKSITPEVKADSSVALMVKSHKNGNSVTFDFDEEEFTKAFPDWRNV